MKCGLAVKSVVAMVHANVASFQIVYNRHILLQAQIMLTQRYLLKRRGG